MKGRWLIGALVLLLLLMLSASKETKVIELYWETWLDDLSMENNDDSDEEYLDN